ncbi:hypothetical protein MKW94_026928 [Papaver nudicaule]|uniref:DUF7769 domain-containing protein n=1 Tax=Papaver nudicaule TaxID=74823 RepID=A0AA41W1B2_PAPNU|nr:hypothetical protein [Papaver nudicaule]
MDNEELEVLDHMDEMDETSCFSETTTDSPEETETSALKASFATRDKKDLTNEQRMTIFHFLLKESNGGKVKRGLVPKAAQQFSVSQATIKRIWKQGKECEEKNLPVNVSSRKPTRVGLTTKEFDWSKITEIPLRRRTNIRSLAKALNIPKSTVHRQRLARTGELPTQIEVSKDLVREATEYLSCLRFFY